MKEEREAKEWVCKAYLGGVDHHLDARKGHYKLPLRGGRRDYKLNHGVGVACPSGAGGVSRFFLVKAHGS